MIYNAFKGDLDAQQDHAICQPIKATFEQKYVVRLLLKIVSNAWRTFQLLGHQDRATEIPILSLWKLSSNHSVDDIYFQNVLFRDGNRSVEQTNTTRRGVLNLGSERKLSTLFSIS
jgi:hypothetical protein